MDNLWSDQDARAAIDRYADRPEELALRVYSSRLIGADKRLVLHGGGNTSVKLERRNRLGEPEQVLHVKGSGWNLGSIEPPGLPGVRLEPLRALRALDSLSDEDMVNELRTNLIDASSPNPSVETLLHAFLPHTFIDHSHADAILVLANQPNAEELCRKVFGDTLAVVPYVMPGFELAKQAAEILEANPHVEGLFLVNHGLFTFGDSAKQSYERHIDAVNKAEAFIAGHRRATLSLIDEPLPFSHPTAALRVLAPLLRGLYRRETDLDWIVHLRESETAKRFATSLESGAWSQLGVATPDHVLRIKPRPLLINVPHNNNADSWREEIDAALRTYIRQYHQYFERNNARAGGIKHELDPLPRVILVQGIGLITIGRSMKEARIAAELYEHTLEIIHQAFSVGEFSPLPDDELFDMEYWSLEQAKLGKKQPAPLQGKVVYITGAASGIGYAAAEEFAAQGANLFLVDRDGKKLAEAAKQLRERHGRVVFNIELDVTDPEAVHDSFEVLAAYFGGLDILISNAGIACQGEIGAVEDDVLRYSFEVNFFAHQRLAAEAVKVFRLQGRGGVLLFNASKAAYNPGRQFGPYALPKATLVALAKQYALDYGSEGIRANVVVADRVRTGLLDEEFVRTRAEARGLTADDYFTHNLLGQEVTPRDVARGFLQLATAERTTASLVTIDGGNIAASPR